MKEISSTMALAHLDTDDARIIQTALKRANTLIETTLKAREELIVPIYGRTYQERMLIREMERNEELYNRIAQLTGIQ